MFALVATTMASGSKKEKRGLLGLSEGLHGLHAENIHGLHAPLATGYSSYAANYPAPLLSASPALSHFQPAVSSYAAPAISHLPAVSTYAQPALPALNHFQPAISSYAHSALPVQHLAPAPLALPAPVQHYSAPLALPAPVQHYSAPLALPAAAPALPIQHYSAAPVQHYSAPLALESFHHAQLPAAPALLKSYAPAQW